MTPISVLLSSNLRLPSHEAYSLHWRTLWGFSIVVWKTGNDQLVCFLRNPLIL